MCGRYALTTTAHAYAEEFGLLPEAIGHDLPPRYNIAPTQRLPVVRAAVDRGQAGDRSRDDAGGQPGAESVLMRWGLIPPWADGPTIGNRMINARSESAWDRPAYRSAIRRRRCLVPATAFYEWKKTGSGKQPHSLTMPGGRLIAFAGLWETWRPRHAGADEQGDQIESYAILTRPAAGATATLHDRMPLIVPPEHYALWLDPQAQQPDALAPVMEATGPAEMLRAQPVSTIVNKPANDVPQCLEPVTAGDLLSGLQ